MLRSLLLALDGIADADAAVETAAYLAARKGAAIDVRLTLDRAAVAEPEAVGVAGLSRAEHRDAVILRRLGGRLDAAGRLASERLSAVEGVAFSIDRLDGDVRAELLRLALGHDLVLLSNALRRRADSDDLDVTFALPAEELIRATPRPFLLADRRPLGDDGPALVAFDGGRAATAALRSAVALGLLEGREVHVASVADDRGEAERLAADGCAILARHDHGATAAPRPLVADGGEAAGLIAAELDALGADLLVMGAFGERSLAEWLFGSTTRDLLARAGPAGFLHAERDEADPLPLT